MSFDPDLEAFVKASLRSLWALELLLFMRRHRDQDWTVESLVAELRGSRHLVEQLLGDFSRSGLIASAEGRHRFQPAGEATDRLCDRLDVAFRERPIAIAALIAKPANNVQAFADAFRIKREKDE